MSFCKFHTANNSILPKMSITFLFIHVNFYFGGFKSFGRSDMKKIGFVYDKAKPALSLSNVKQVAERKFFFGNAAEDFAVDDRYAAEHISETGFFSFVAFGVAFGRYAVVAVFVASDV